MKNVVFDYGQVLVHFEPSQIVKEYVSDAEDAALLEKVIFAREYWDRLDEGMLSNEAFLAAVRDRLPERLHSLAEEIYFGWIYHIPEVEGVGELIQHLKSRYGVSVYLLSNISAYFAEHAAEMPLLHWMDGCVFSALCGLVKPDVAIYEHLCTTFCLKPEETVFIDDRAENIASAQAMGITGYLFDGDVEKLRTFLDRLLKDGLAFSELA